MHDDALTTLARSYPTVAGTAEYDRKIGLIKDALRQARRLVSIAHPFSDGDALGSQLALHHWAEWQGKDCVSLNFDPLPPQISWLPGTAALVDRLPDGEPFDLFFLMETTDPARLGEERTRLFARARTRIHLDHHPGLRGLGEINLIDEGASSTCEILYYILKDDHRPLPLTVLEPLYLGIMTDTGNFRYANTTPRAHRIAAEMLEAGLRVPPIYKKVYEANSHTRVAMHGRAMARVARAAGGKIVHSWLTAADFAEIGASEVDADGCISHLCSIVGMEVALLFRELPDGRLKVSFRSAGRVDVQALAKAYGGGGHTLAASANVAGRSLADLRQEVLDRVAAALAAAETGSAADGPRRPAGATAAEPPGCHGPGARDEGE
ncbi:MAG: hypothetical protein OZSIB_0824 [Candidatus Ozemobacter sibiricus]|uniref:Uncharacterized protein n=1 Tax=Candidatus Ozemobacter sibiricus TaxID=2268124 RepID=A0A367ZUH5_9BACT|nr:MAG: hypothetical protein OZSIB_0824 [Candidatus Ozemobacter sibiricus]